MNSKVSVILLNWNGAEFTIPCVKSLQLQTYNNFDIIIVDNGSTDDSLQRIRKEFKNAVHVLSLEKNIGFTGGNNVGIQYGLKNHADYVLILNNDTIADPKFIEELVTLAETDGRIGIVTGKIFYFEPRDLLWFAGGDVHRGLLRFRHRGILEKDIGHYDHVSESNFITGCCMLIRREIFEKVGLFDVRFFIYCEDVDYSLRVHGMGYKLMYTPYAVLYHKESATMRKNTLPDHTGTVSARQYYLSTRNYIYVIRKHFTLLEYIVSITYVIMKSLLWSIFFIGKRRWKKLSSMWKGVIDGLYTDLKNEKTGST